MRKPELLDQFLNLWRGVRSGHFLFSFFLITNLFLPLVTSAPNPGSTGGTTYYLDCNGGDSNSGASPAQAWKTLDKANKAKLSPGDSFLLKRGCTWRGTFEASWHGTEEKPIRIGAYGQGSLPLIQNGTGDLEDKHHNAFRITGSYQIIENIETTVVNPPRDPGCRDQTYGFYTGFSFLKSGNNPNSGSYNTLQNSKATHLTAGIYTSTETHHNRLLYNTLTDNNVMHKLTPKTVNASDDLGAWGILLHGDNHEVAYNYLSNNAAWCAYDFAYAGNAVELYEARNNSIHHNISIDDITFSELGGSANLKSENNTYSYNLVVSKRPMARFIVARGAGNKFGPNPGTKLFHNTVYYTAPDSQAFTCGSGCGTNILTARNNIFWAEEKAAFVDQPFNESNNLYWNSSGNPFVQFLNSSMSPSSRKANPQFANPAALDFHLKAGSPAVDAGADLSWLATVDLDGSAVPHNGRHDIGAFEFTGGN